jgi:hypothetical protein
MWEFQHCCMICMNWPRPTYVWCDDDPMSSIWGLNLSFCILFFVVESWIMFIERKMKRKRNKVQLNNKALNWDSNEGQNDIFREIQYSMIHVILNVFKGKSRSTLKCKISRSYFWNMLQTLLIITYWNMIEYVVLNVTIRSVLIQC